MQNEEIVSQKWSFATTSEENLNAKSSQEIIGTTNANLREELENTEVIVISPNCNVDWNS